MSWQNQGGSGGGPWGGGQSPWGGRGGGRGPQPPNLEDILRRSQDRFRRVLPGGWGSGRGVILVVLGLLAIWVLSGIYRVQPDERGIVLRFGAYNRTALPGLNYHLPAPIEHAFTPKVTRINPIEIGFRPVPDNRQIDAEALMLTGDENIVDINFTVFWVIKDAPKFLFNIRHPEATVKAAAESAMREVIGSTAITDALTEGREKIAKDTKELTQRILNSYDSGIDIADLVLQKTAPPSQVNDAFIDVQNAKSDLNRLINEAQAYRNDLLPKARGDAVRIVQEAEAYRQQIVRQAEGDAARFLSVYQAYKLAEDVTARRLYIEAMESVLKNANKIILDKAAIGSGVLPYLPLPSIGSQASPARNPAPPPQSPYAATPTQSPSARGGRP